MTIDTHLWGRYRSYFHSPLLPIISTVAASLLQVGSLLAIAYLIGALFDSIIPSHDLSAVLRAVSGMILLYGLNSALAVWSRHVTLTLTKQAVARLRLDLLDAFYRISWESYIRNDQSVLQTMMVQDTERVDLMSNALLGRILPAVMVCFSLALLLIYLNVYLFLFIVVMVFVLYGSMFLSRQRIGRNVASFHDAFEGFSSGIHHLLKRMSLTRVRSFDRVEIERQRDRVDYLYLTSRRFAWFGSALGSLQDTVVFVFSLVILAVGGWAVGQQIMTLGELLTFYVILGMLRGYFRMTTVAFPQIVEGWQSLRRILTFIDRDDGRPYNGKQTTQFQGSITLKQVRFSYGGRDVLSDVSLSLTPGVTTAVVGRNGAGKSTVASLIIGLYRPLAGQLLADDIPYDDLDIAELRKNIGFVAQNPLLIPGTILDNVIYGHFHVSPDQLERAAILSTANEFIMNLPDQYKTPVGDDGVFLSGGQRQRIALARAVLGNPKLLILDEPTNHIDQEMIFRFINNLRTHGLPPAVLLLTHSLQLIQQADLVYWLENGVIQAQGAHDKLMDQEKIYQQLFQPQ